MIARGINFHLQVLLLAASLGAALASNQEATGLLENARNHHHHQQQQQQQQAGAQPQQALTAEEWTRKYRCDLAAPNSSLVQSIAERKRLIDAQPWPLRHWLSIVSECNRDQALWPTRYIDELLYDYKVLVKDPSLDERLANILNTLSLHSLVDTNYYQFNSGDPKVDRENELRAAGAAVDDGQCELDLYEMAQQLDELTAHLRQMRLGVNNTRPLEEREIKLARVLDAFGRYESGTLSANLRFPGSYEQCGKSVLERRALTSGPSKDMQMRYCWARTSLRERLNPFVKQRQNQPHESGDDSLPVAVCLPKSCHSRNLNSAQNKRLVKKLLDSQLKFPASIYLDQHPELESVFCLPDADSASVRMQTRGKLWVAFTAFWLLACCLATYFKVGEQPAQELDQKTGVAYVKEPQMNLMLSMKQNPAGAGERSGARPSTWTNIGKCLNLNLSWQDFSSDRVEPDAKAPVDLDVLNPVKVGACLFCVVSHSALMYATRARQLLDTAAKVERDSILQASLATSTVIDTFFVISGLLISYIGSKRLARMAARNRPAPAGSMDHKSGGSRVGLLGSTANEIGSWSFSAGIEFMGGWIMLAANRYFRLVPLYAFIFFFRRDVFKYLGSGPLWDYGFNRDTMTGACEQSSSLLPFSFDSLRSPLMKQCLVTAWTTSNDILFGLLIPPFLLMLQTRPKPTVKIMSAIVILCALYGVKILLDQPNMDRFEMLEIRMHGIVMLFNGLNGLYTSPIIRAASFLVGAIAGFALFRYAEQRGERKWPTWLAGTATKLSAVYIILHVVLSTLHMDFSSVIGPYHRLYTAYLMTFDRTVWSAANAVLFLRMTTDWRHGFFSSKFAGQKWKSLARLNYPILFVHWLVIIVQTDIVVSLPNYSHWNLFACFATVYLACMPVSLLLHVAFENPMDKLIKRQILKL